MNEKEELIRFVEHIVKNGSGYNTEKSLKELRDIMVRNGASAEIAQWLDGMIDEWARAFRRRDSRSDKRRQGKNRPYEPDEMLAIKTVAGNVENPSDFL